MSHVHPLDAPRIATLLSVVRDVMGDGEWFTLAQLQTACDRRGVHGSEAGLSARIRDLRKPQHGSRVVERKRLTDTGLHSYRLVPVVPAGQQGRLFA